jgi:addiction module HigA family antidote
MKKLRNIHPGEVLQEEFLIPLGLSAYKLSKDIGIPQTRVSEILKGKRRVTADTALTLSKYFGIPLSFGWGYRTILNLRRPKNWSLLSTNWLVQHNDHSVRPSGFLANKVPVCVTPRSK